MSFGEMVKEVAAEYQVTQEYIATVANVDRTTANKYCNGSRKVTKHFAKVVTQELDHPKVYLEAVREITGGAFCFGWLDGEEVDLNPSSIEQKLTEEVEEMFRAIHNRRTGIRFERSFEDRDEAVSSVLEVVDVAHACCIYIAVACQKLELSPAEIFNLHERKIVERGYKKEKAPTYAQVRG